MQIYIHRENEQFGPYSLEQARTYLASGELLPHDLAWREGAADWAPLAEVVIVTPVVPPLPQLAPVPARGTRPAGTPSAPPAAETAESSLDKSRRRKRKRSSSSSSSSNPITRQQKSLGTRNMVVGALCCAGGTAVTVLSYEAASDAGGIYLVTWGAILFGGIRFLKGVVQFSKA